MMREAANKVLSLVARPLSSPPPPPSPSGRTTSGGTLFVVEFESCFLYEAFKDFDFLFLPAFIKYIHREKIWHLSVDKNSGNFFYWKPQKSYFLVARPLRGCGMGERAGH